MKKTFKRIFSLLAVMVMGVCCFSFTACEDITTLEVTVAVYNYEDGVYYEDLTIEVDLYGHLAPKTVDAIIEYAEQGYYNNKTFYKIDGYSSQIMVGDLKVVEGAVNQTTKPEIVGEFEYNATKGSNLTNTLGSVGLWRSWTIKDNESAKFERSNGMDTGRATWFMPTNDISGYNGYFCVFGQIDMEDEDNQNAFNKIQEVINANTEEYVIYYTGSYDESKANENYGLTFNCMLKSDFDELSEDETADIYYGDNSSLYCYNKTTVSIPKLVDGHSGARIKSIKVK